VQQFTVAHLTVHWPRPPDHTSTFAWPLSDHSQYITMQPHSSSVENAHFLF